MHNTAQAQLFQKLISLYTQKNDLFCIRIYVIVVANSFYVTFPGSIIMAIERDRNLINNNLVWHRCKLN